MKTHILIVAIFFIGISKQSSAQIDLDNINLKDIIGKVMHVEHGFSPKFSLGNFRIPKIPKVAEILGLKKSPQVNSLFNTFRTGRTIFQKNNSCVFAIFVFSWLSWSLRVLGY